MEWLREHHWQWDMPRLESALPDIAHRTTALAGTAFNMFSHLSRFNLIVLLQIDDDTMATRLVQPDRNNDFGKAGDTVAWSRYWRHRVEIELTNRGAHLIDARQPVDRVVENLIEVCSDSGYPIGQL